MFQSPIPLLALAGLLAGLVPAPGAEPDTVKAVCYNIRYDNPRDGENAWPHRKEAVAAFLKEQDADVSGLQEALAHQLDFLLASDDRLASLGVGRDDGKRAGEFSPILYRKDRVRPGKHGTFWLSDTPDVPGSTSWGNEITRIVTWAAFTHIASGKDFLVVNTHFDHRSQPSREKSAQAVLDHLARSPDPGRPTIVMGDLNAGEDNPAFLTLRAKLADPFRTLHPDATEVGTTTGFRPKRGKAKIDHILTNAGFNPVEAEIHVDPPGGPRSDHLAVSAVLAFAGGG